VERAIAQVGRVLPSLGSIEDYAVRRLRVTPLVPRLPGSRIPRPIGPDFEARVPSVRRLLALKGLDRELLDLIGATLSSRPVAWRQCSDGRSGAFESV
jgi:hypothetical protein